MMTLQNFQEQINLVINKGKSNIGLTQQRDQLTVAAMAAYLTSTATALGTDTTTHSREIDTPAAVLNTNLGR